MSNAQQHRPSSVRGHKSKVPSDCGSVPEGIDQKAESASDHDHGVVSLVALHVRICIENLHTRLLGLTHRSATERMPADREAWYELS
jgi:hypothetical protein